MIYHTQKAKTIADVCLLAGCFVQLMANCAREVGKSVALAVEVVRKLSHTFARLAAAQAPSHKQIRGIAKMLDAVAKAATAELLHYLVASFASHVAVAQIEDEAKGRSLEASIFPVLEKCTRKQLAEVATALHDIHRQIFQQLYTRWEAESKYKGKV
jgi:hypothetical protein